MKKILLAIFLFGSIGFASAQCPKSFKSDVGGGSCDNTYLGLTYTARITLEYNTVPSCFPRITKVEDQNGETFNGLVAPGQLSPSGKSVVYCVYGTAPSQNFFNQPDLILSLKYPLSCPTTGDSATVRCGPNSETPLPVHFKS